MRTAEIIANYIEHKRGLGMRFATENAILIAFGRFVGNVALCEIRSAMIPRFVDRGGTTRLRAKSTTSWRVSLALRSRVIC